MGSILKKKVIFFVFKVIHITTNIFLNIQIIYVFGNTFTDNIISVLELSSGVVATYSTPYANAPVEHCATAVAIHTQSTLSEEIIALKCIAL